MQCKAKLSEPKCQGDSLWENLFPCHLQGQIWLLANWRVGLQACHAQAFAHGEERGICQSLGTLAFESVIAMILRLKITTKKKKRKKKKSNNIDYDSIKKSLPLWAQDARESREESLPRLPEALGTVPCPLEAASAGPHVPTYPFSSGSRLSRLPRGSLRGNHRTRWSLSPGRPPARASRPFSVLPGCCVVRSRGLEKAGPPGGLSVQTPQLGPTSPPPQAHPGPTASAVFEPLGVLLHHALDGSRHTPSRPCLDWS